MDLEQGERCNTFSTGNNDNEIEEIQHSETPMVNISCVELRSHLTATTATELRPLQKDHSCTTASRRSASSPPGRFVYYRRPISVLRQADEAPVHHQVNLCTTEGPFLYCDKPTKRQCTTKSICALQKVDFSIHPL